MKEAFVMVRTAVGLSALLVASGCFAQSVPPLLLRYPSASATKIVFVYGDDLWQVSRDGGVAERLTSGMGKKSHPYFSPDGSQIAFSAEVPLPIAQDGSYSPDGSQIAYVPLNHAFEIWKHYRGGRASPIWLAR